MFIFEFFLFIFVLTKKESGRNAAFFFHYDSILNFFVMS
ncbi:hypothetical protein BSBH6_03955 [Bacillus subtilis]|nr:hypothetical protein BSBH6_03955 [Bacillus subtilis]RPK20164.1 hypothetical protein BH5_03956 [Bacillus subtilis]